MGVNQSTYNEGGDGREFSAEMNAATEEMRFEETATNNNKTSEESSVGHDGTARSTNLPGKQDIEMESPQLNYKRAGSIIPPTSRTAEIIAANPEQTKTKLDEKTLKILKDYLMSLKFEKDPLEEEEVVELSLKICQYANDRVKFRQNLLQDASDVDDTYFDQVYRKEKYFALAHEFLNLITYEINSLSEKTEPKTRINNNTVRWVRKAAGLNRPHDDRNDHRHAHHHQNNSDGRLTRGMANKTRVKIRENKRKAEQAGLDALLLAVAVIERERGEPFPEIKNDKDDDANDYYRGKRRSKKKHVLVARIRGAWNNPLLSTQVRVTRILVNGKHVKRPTSDEEFIDWRLEHMREQNRKRELEPNSVNLVSEDGYSSAESSVEEEKETDDLPASSERDPLDLTFSAWMYHCDLGLHNADHDDDDMVPNSTDIPEGLLKEGIEFFPHRQGEEFTSAAKPTSIRGQTKRRSDDIYLKLSQKVLNVLRTKPGRIQIRCEFFLPDIDKPWYELNEFAADVAKLGIRPSASLTRREWSLIRRKIKPRPRLFSRNFIVSEIKKRNKLRKMVRKLQHQPSHLNTTGLDVPAPIEPGQRVTAYNKKFRVLHGGVVVSHDKEKHGYEIDFRQEDLGVEFCPDIDVARCRTQAGEERMEADSWVVLRGYDGKLPAKKAPGRDKDPDLERNDFVRLLSIVDACVRRKRLILDGINKCRILEENRHTTNFGAASPTEGSESIQSNIHAWLLANLVSTNEALESARLHLEAMYGEINNKNGRRDHHGVATKQRRG